MAFTGITATEAEINQAAGANASASFTDTMKTQALLQEENYLNVETGFNWSDVWAASLDVDVKYLITQFTASRVAMRMIKYDMGSIGLSEAQTRLDFLNDAAQSALKTIKLKPNQSWLRAV